MPYLMIRLEGRIRGILKHDPAEGAALVLWLERADEAARARGVAPPSDFLGMLPAEFAQLKALACAFGFPRPDEPTRARVDRWCDPAAGLATVRALRAHVAEHADDLEPDPHWPGGGAFDGFAAMVASDLAHLEAVLTKAERQGLRFHLYRGE